MKRTTAVAAASTRLPDGIEACQFDMDGVLAETATVHAAETVGGLANGKNETVLRLMCEHGVGASPGSVRFLLAVRGTGLRTAVVSSSANCREVLEAAGIADLFDARVDGTTIKRDHLNGKPAPDSFLAAARELGVEPAAGQAVALRRHGADVVVSDLADLLAPS